MKNIQKLPTITLLAGLITLVSCGDDNPDAESNNINIDSTLETPTLSNFRQAFSFTRDRQIDTLRADNTGGGELIACEHSGLPRGLSIAITRDGESCKIEGTPLEAKAELDYIITAININGSSSASLTIVVNEPAVNEPADNDPPLAAAPSPTPEAPTEPLPSPPSPVPTPVSPTDPQIPAPQPSEEPAIKPPTPEPTNETRATPEPPAEPSAQPSAVPSPSVTAAPSIEPTIQPTIEPTPEPSVTPTPTPEPSTQPTATPSAEPTPALRLPDLVDVQSLIVDKYDSVNIELINVGGGELSSCSADLPAGLQVSVTSDNASCEISGEALEAYSGNAIEIIATNKVGSSSANATLAINDVREFITRWRTSNLGVSDNNQLLLETSPNFIYAFRVDWGDGQVDHSVSESITHTYENAGDYTVKISGNYPKPHQSFVSDAKKLLSIEQWGDQIWQSMESAFFDCDNLELRANDTPNLSQVSSMSSMFRNTQHFNGNIVNWDVSAVTDMSYMFHEAPSFNRDISSWDVAQVRDMSSMFFEALSFDQNLGNWDVSSVEDMSYMFDAAGLSTDNYDKVLLGWQALNLQDDVRFDAGYSTYSNQAASARANIINQHNWQISDSPVNE